MICATSFAETEDVQIGESTNTVIAALGEPKGIIESGTYQVLIYPRGEIVFRNGRATSVALLTPAEAERKQAMWRRKEAEWRRLQAEVAKRAAAEAAAKAARHRAAAGSPMLMPDAPKSDAAPEMTEEEKERFKADKAATQLLIDFGYATNDDW